MPTRSRAPGSPKSPAKRVRRQTPAAQSDAAKYKRFEKYSVSQLVLEARPIARDLIQSSIDALWLTSIVETDVSLVVSELLGVERDDYLPDNNPELTRALLALRVAFAIGFSTGQLVRGEAFAGARTRR